MHEKIEAGRWYKMRNGGKAYVAGIVPKELQAKYCVHGFIESRKNGDGDSWMSNGEYKEYKYMDDYDLISLWEEPNEVKLPEKVENAFNPTERRINQLIDFCESLQARVKELESGIIKREYGG